MFDLQKTKRHQDDIVLPCLSVITPELILVAHMHNKWVQVFYNHHKCRNCPLNHNVSKTMETLRELDYITNYDIELIDDEFDKKARKKSLKKQQWFTFHKQKSNEQTEKLILIEQVKLILKIKSQHLKEESILLNI
ncbi:hypothetical protein H1D32_04265 [Anaerobacillus sp. CMMVII]|uniref:hypothetical protein n=1 Tax=Anaerobacillus sp. CMMVII TaxID=2755588 RepID=UPI0021B7CC63|nr:hypothetical protein [Anaerobacillus sp. CMMVII]MCT8137020.1 hypothetical protein [Anaerobacillus sp. CMMVII]